MFGFLGLSGQIFQPATTAAQAQGFSSPTYAASAEGSPYASGAASPHSDIYARTFGSTGAATTPTIPSAADPTAAAPPSEELVYVINSKGLLTFRAADFAEGTGEAIAHNPIPLPFGPNGGPAAPPLLPTVADSLYLQPPLETAAGKAATGPDEPQKTP